MKDSLSKPLFWSNVVSLTFVGVVAAGLAFGWNNPSAPPVGGNGAIYVNGTGDVGIGNAIPATKLDVSGNVRWSGTLTAGSVPWLRLTGIPGPCGAGQFVTNMNTGGCATPAAASVAWTSITGIPAGFADNIDNTSAGGGVTGSGTGGSLAMWTGVGASTALGNPSGTITFPNDINVTGLTTGAPSTQFGTQAGSNAGFWGGINTSAAGLNWSRTCPAGQIMVGIGQSGATVGGPGNVATPYIICAPL